MAGHRATTVCATVAVLAATVAGATPAAAAADPIDRFTLSAAAVESYANLKHDLDHPVASLGFSEVSFGEWENVQCEATAAGYWLGQHEEHPLMENAVPQRNKAGDLPVRNPTMENQVRPVPHGYDDGLFDWSDAHPAVPAGPGARWAAGCAEDGSSGRATGITYAGPGPRAAGSTVSAVRDPVSGRYSGTARAFAQDLGVTAGGRVDSITSLLHVEAPPGAREPRVSYRLTLTWAAASAEPQVRADSKSLTLLGVDVPASGLTRHFEEQRRAAMPVSGLAGVTVVAPAVAHDAGWHYRIAAPAVVVSLAPRPCRVRGRRHAAARLSCLPGPGAQRRPPHRCCDI